MEADRSRYGLLVSALGAALLAVAVFLPWYGLRHTGAAAGVQFAAVSAHHAFRAVSIVLLVVAGLALLEGLLPLTRAARVPAGAGGSLGVLGTVAAIFIAYRMVDIPALGSGGVAPMLREGPWLALAGAVAIVAGGVWPRVSLPPALAAQSHFDGGWSGLTRWTPQR